MQFDCVNTVQQTVNFMNIRSRKRLIVLQEAAAWHCERLSGKRLSIKDVRSRVYVCRWVGKAGGIQCKHFADKTRA